MPEKNAAKAQIPNFILELLCFSGSAFYSEDNDRIKKARAHFVSHALNW
jgi:hypothetical protein